MNDLCQFLSDIFMNSLYISQYTSTWFPSLPPPPPPPAKKRGEKVDLDVISVLVLLIVEGHFNSKWFNDRNGDAKAQAQF